MNFLLSVLFSVFVVSSLQEEADINVWSVQPVLKFNATNARAGYSIQFSGASPTQFHFLRPLLATPVQDELECTDSQKKQLKEMVKQLKSDIKVPLDVEETEPEAYLKLESLLLSSQIDEFKKLNRFLAVQRCGLAFCFISKDQLFGLKNSSAEKKRVTRFLTAKRKEFMTISDDLVAELESILRQHAKTEQAAERVLAEVPIERNCELLLAQIKHALESSDGATMWSLENQEDKILFVRKSPRWNIDDAGGFAAIENYRFNEFALYYDAFYAIVHGQGIEGIEVLPSQLTEFEKTEEWYRSKTSPLTEYFNSIQDRAEFIAAHEGPKGVEYRRLSDEFRKRIKDCFVPEQDAVLLRNHIRESKFSLGCVGCILLIDEVAESFDCDKLKIDLKEYSSLAEKKIKKFEKELWDGLLECLDEDHQSELSDLIELPNRMEISSTLLLN